MSNNFICYLQFMTVRKEIPYTSGVYFITFTCHNWLPLFEMLNAYEEVYKQFDILKSEGHYIIGYVIMPNHIHVIVAFRETGKSINRRIGTFKRFLAYELVKRLQKAGKTDILSILSDGVNTTDRQKGKLHNVFEPSFDCKECYDDKIIMQKLNYIHNNPCKGKWQLANNFFEYPHSSAKFYTLGEQGIYEVTNYMKLADIDLTAASS